MADLIERLLNAASGEDGLASNVPNTLLREAAAALEAAREDAERYRWLRDREMPEWLDLWHQNPDRIDAAIDHARGKENGNG